MSGETDQLANRGDQGEDLPEWQLNKAGREALEAGDFSEAAEAFRRAIAMDASEPWFYHGLGMALVRQASYAEAEEQLRVALELDPSIAWFYHGLSCALRGQDRLDEAIIASTEAINLLPGEAMLYRERAAMYMVQKNVTNAEMDLEAAAGLTPDEPYFPAELGRLLVTQNRCREAMPWFQRAIDLDQDNAWYRYYLGDAHARTEQIEEAERWLGLAMELDPQEGFFHRRLAEVLTDADRPEEAAAAYRESIRHDPDDPSLWCALGDVLTKMGRQDEAGDCYQKAVRVQVPEGDRARLARDTGADAGPDFLIIGFPKCGTTALFSYLCRHECLLPPATKEPAFFSEHYHHGLDWYRAHFSFATTSPQFVTGEASTAYSVHPDSAERIREHFPNVKLIALVRDPVDRAVSDYGMWRSTGWEHRSFDRVIGEEIDALRAGRAITTTGEKPTYVASGLFHDHLTRWTRLFPLEHILVLRAEDLLRDPASTVAETFRFLGLDDKVQDSYEPINVGKPVATDEPTRAALARFYEPHNQALESHYGVRVSGESW